MERQIESLELQKNPYQCNSGNQIHNIIPLIEWFTLSLVYIQNSIQILLTAHKSHHEHFKKFTH